MANSAEPSSPKLSVAGVPSATVWKIRILGLFTALFVLLYSGAWFYASGWIKTRVGNQIASGRENGQSWQCPDLDIRGYPFRIGLFCSSIALDIPASGLSLTAGKLQSAAQVYYPGHSIVELEGPLELHANTGLQVSATWDLAHASVVAGLKGLNRYSMELKALQSRFTSANPASAFSVASPDAQIHLRQNGADLDFAATLLDASVAMAVLPTSVPPFSFAADLTLAGQAGLIAGVPMTSLHNQSVTIRQIQIDAGAKGLVRLSGPITIDHDGLVSGTITVTVDKVEALRTTVTGLFPETTETANMVAPLLAGMAQADGTVTLTLTIARGAVSLGLIPLGVVPSL